MKHHCIYSSYSGLPQSCILSLLLHKRLQIRFHCQGVLYPQALNKMINKRMTDGIQNITFSIDSDLEMWFYFCQQSELAGTEPGIRQAYTNRHVQCQTKADRLLPPPTTGNLCCLWASGFLKRKKGRVGVNIPSLLFPSSPIW